MGAARQSHQLRRRAFGMRDRATCSHPVNVPRYYGLHGTQAVPMHHLPLEEVGHGRQSNMGMRPDIEIFERFLLLGPEVIKKKKRPDSLPSRRRQKATH